MNLGEFLTEETGVTTQGGKFPHHHTYKITGRDGYGRTTKTIGEGPRHTHYIERFEVEASGPDDHMHILERR